MGGLVAKLRALFSKQLEIVIIGLENSGKTTLLNQLTEGAPLTTVPTIGMNVKTVQKGHLKMKMWDIGGQVQYRGEWSWFAKSSNVILFVVDTAAPDFLPLSRKELHLMLEDKELTGMPILVLANKIDLDPHLSEQEVIQGLNLDYIVDNPWVVISLSALQGLNIEKIVDWLVSQRK